MEFVFEWIPPCRTGYLLTDQKVTEESPGENTIRLRRQTALSSMLFSPGPQEIRLAAVGFSMASETENSCTPIWSKRLAPNGGSRRPPSECYPATPLAEAFFQDCCDSRTDSQRPGRARRLYSQRIIFSATKRQRQRGKTDISYALPAPVNRKWHCVEQKEVRNHRFRGSLGTFHPWKVPRRRHDNPLE